MSGVSPLVTQDLARPSTSPFIISGLTAGILSPRGRNLTSPSRVLTFVPAPGWGVRTPTNVRRPWAMAMSEVSEKSIVTAVPRHARRTLAHEEILRFVLLADGVVNDGWN